jgi:hypothetical protein
MDDIDPNARILVAVVTRQRDLAAARDEGWYRIPLARAPRAGRCAIWPRCAPSALSRAPRCCPRRPATHARARYYRIAIGSLLALPAPLPSRRLRRIAFIPTTAGQLLRARDLIELWRPDEDTAGWEELWGAGVNRRG